MAPVVAATPQVLVDESTRLANSTVARIVKASKGGSLSAVSYTHLTLPTKA